MSSPRMDFKFAMRPGGLPQELVEILTQTYFLHLLATEPETVIPDGKSFLSMMAHSRLKPKAEEPAALLHDRVERAMKDAFWKQALAALSDPTPSVQIDRLKGLLSDVREAISPLFPASHSIIETLSAPVPPTASPLVSTTLLLKEILVALRSRAAPVRDPTIDELLADLDAPLSPIAASGPSSSIRTSTSELALRIISTMKSILSLADSMKSDLNQFVLGSMTETQLKDIVVQQAKAREKSLVLDIWGDSGKDGSQRIQMLWQTWVDELEEQQASEAQPSDRWIHRLVQSLGSTEAVACPIPDDAIPDDTVGNQLPPQFFFTTPRLLYAQNYLQALVVAASLRSLTRLPPPTQHEARGHDFMERVWTLLKAEIDEEDAPTTKIINFADEVVRARGLVSSPDGDEEAQLRAAVDRTLNYGDPVFLLLQKRLLTAITHQLQVKPITVSKHAPERMQTGRALDERAGKRPRLVDPPVASGSSRPAMPVVKGFEDPLLVSGIGEVSTMLYRHVRWVGNVWIDV